MRSAYRISVVVILGIAAGAALAETIPNWTVPKSSAFGRTANADISPGPVVFVAVDPCRVIDTRGNGFSGEWGPPSMPGGGTQRSFTIGGQCGILAGATAVSMNFTVWAPSTRGDIRVFPAGGATPTAATMLWEANILGLSNAAVAPLGTAEKITVQVDGPGTINLIVDVNGYYIGGTTPLNSGERLHIEGSYGSGGIIKGTNNNPGGSSYGGFFETYGTGTDATGVYGQARGATGKVWGAVGETWSTTDGTAGVYGLASGATGMTFGVYGLSSSTGASAAGVLGLGGGAAYPNNVFIGTVGVLGNTTTGWGILGKATTGHGVQGCLVNATTGNAITGSCGVLGHLPGVGVFSYGDVGGIGAKTFIEPHPTDPSRQIVYVSMEGPEAGTYFRGRGRFEGKTAVIPVPEYFRLVTEEEGLTVQITPIGRAAAVGVTSMDLNRIVVEATRDVEFSYLVQGVRRNYGGFEPIQRNTTFVPTGPGARMEPYPAHIQQRLVEIGIYNEDGSVNLRTAERLGWARKWREEERARVDAARLSSVSKPIPRGDGQ